MIVKTSKGYVVKSENGKTLSRPYKTSREARRRLYQIEWFRDHKK